MEERTWFLCELGSNPRPTTCQAEETGGNTRLAGGLGPGRRGQGGAHSAGALLPLAPGGARRHRNSRRLTSRPSGCARPAPPLSPAFSPAQPINTRRVASNWLLLAPPAASGVGVGEAAASGRDGAVAPEVPHGACGFPGAGPCGQRRGARAAGQPGGGWRTSPSSRAPE